MIINMEELEKHMADVDREAFKCIETSDLPEHVKENYRLLMALTIINDTNESDPVSSFIGLAATIVQTVVSSEEGNKFILPLTNVFEKVGMVTLGAPKPKTKSAILTLHEGGKA